jgi:hypothetical protein
VVRRKIREEIFEGLQFINGHEAVRSLYVLLSSSTLFMMAPWIVLGPQIAKEQAGATGSQTTALFALLGVVAGCIIFIFLIYQCIENSN